jgi:hypothetical protein
MCHSASMLVVGQLAITCVAFAGAATAQETASEPIRCIAVRHLCEDRDASCDALKRQLEKDGVVCQHSNAQAAAPTEESTARLEANREQAEADRSRDEAARQYTQMQFDAQILSAIQTCIALAYDRQNALATSANASARNIANIQQGTRALVGVTIESACRRNPSWYLTIPIAPPTPQRSHCESDLQGGYDCTSQ